MDTQKTIGVECCAECSHWDKEKGSQEYDCEKCNGAGGYDASKSCEDYDDWQECPYCEGTGKHKYDEIFDPKRDAWTASD